MGRWPKTYNSWLRTACLTWSPLPVGTPLSLARCDAVFLQMFGAASDRVVGG